MKVELSPAEFHDLMNALGLALMDYQDRKTLISNAIASVRLPIPPAEQEGT